MSLFSNKKTEEKEVKSAKVEKASPAKKTSKTVKKENKPTSMKSLYADSGKEVSSIVSDSSNKKKSLAIAGRILIKPLITEKGSVMSISGKYLFAVSDKANKIEIEKAIFEVYGVKPLKVNIINMEGKIKRHGRTTGKRKDWKKAIVTLPKGKTIQVYEGI
jgi:large subunit ribosomal protein L23